MIMHGAPAAPDAGPNLLKLSESASTAAVIATGPLSIKPKWAERNAGQDPQRIN
jgi:hypothetical protein